MRSWLHLNGYVYSLSDLDTSFFFANRFDILQPSPGWTESQSGSVERIQFMEIDQAKRKPNLNIIIEGRKVVVASSTLSTGENNTTSIVITMELLLRYQAA